MVGPVDDVHYCDAELVAPDGYRCYGSFCVVGNVPRPSPPPVKEEYDLQRSKVECNVRQCGCSLVFLDLCWGKWGKVHV